jgi:hypothetical protein
MAETELFDIINLLTSVGNAAKFRKNWETYLVCLKLIYFFFFHKNAKFGPKMQELTNSNGSGCLDRNLEKRKNFDEYSALIYLQLSTEIVKILNTLRDKLNLPDWLKNCYHLQSKVSDDFLSSCPRTCFMSYIINSFDLLEFYPLY